MYISVVLHLYISSDRPLELGHYYCYSYKPYHRVKLSRASRAEMSGSESESSERFLRKYNANDRQIASEFLSDWLPFLTNGLCHSCNHKLTRRVRSLRPGIGSNSSFLRSAFVSNSTFNFISVYYLI